MAIIEESDNDIAIVDTLMSLVISYLHIGYEKRAVEYLGETYEMAKEIGYDESDDIEIGAGNKIPLWLFGFLY